MTWRPRRHVVREPPAVFLGRDATASLLREVHAADHRRFREQEADAPMAWPRRRLSRAFVEDPPTTALVATEGLQRLAALHDP